MPDGVMVYRAADDSVHHLNPSATIVFELCEGRTRDELVPAVADLLDLSWAEAGAVVDDALAALTPLRLIGPIAPLTPQAVLAGAGE